MLLTILKDSEAPILGGQTYEHNTNTRVPKLSFLTYIVAGYISSSLSKSDSKHVPFRLASTPLIQKPISQSHMHLPVCTTISHHMGKVALPVPSQLRQLPVIQSLTEPIRLPDRLSNHQQIRHLTSFGFQRSNLWYIFFTGASKTSCASRFTSHVSQE